MVHCACTAGSETRWLFSSTGNEVNPAAGALKRAFVFTHVGQVFGFFGRARRAASRHLAKSAQQRARHSLQASDAETELGFSFVLQFGQNFPRNADRGVPGMTSGWLGPNHCM